MNRPETAAEVSAAWLGEVLDGVVPRPSGIVLGPVGPTAHARRIRLEYGDAVHGHGNGHGPARSMVLRFPSPIEGVRRFKEGLDLPRIEVEAYRVAVGTDVFRLPRLYTAVPWDAKETSFILLLEDVGTGEGLDVSRLPEAVRALASFHARWLGRIPPEWDWLPNENDARRVGLLASMFEATGIAAIEQAEWLPRELRRDARALGAAIPFVYSELARGPVTLVHGDLHAANLIPEDGGFASVDWEAAARARGVVDLAFLLMSALPSPADPAAERELLRQYAEAMTAAGAADGARTLMTDYRLALLACFVRRVALRSAYAAVPDDPGLRNVAGAIIRHRALDALPAARGLR